MDTLHLSLNQQPFELMYWGIKKLEFRKPTEWIKSRLIDKHTGKPKAYSQVKFTNGYGNDKPFFIAKYHGYSIANIPLENTYCNMFTVNVEKGDYILKLGYVTEKGNYNTPPSYEIIEALKTIKNENRNTINRHTSKRQAAQTALRFV